MSSLPAAAWAAGKNTVRSMEGQNRSKANQTDKERAKRRYGTAVHEWAMRHNVNIGMAMLAQQIGSGSRCGMGNRVGPGVRVRDRAFDAADDMR